MISTESSRKRKLEEGEECSSRGPSYLCLLNVDAFVDV